MNAADLQYIQRVSCADIRTLLAERAALLNALREAVGCLEACLDELSADTRNSVESDVTSYNAVIKRVSQ